MRIETMGRPRGCKLIRLSADIDDGIITCISIRGDFFASPEEGFDAAEKRLEGTKVSEAGRVFDGLLKEELVETFGISGAALDELLQKALAGEGSR